MATRLRKRIGWCLLGLALGAAVAFLIVRLVLPSFVARQITGAMIAGGLRDPNVRVRSLGLWESQLTDVRAGAESWSLELDTATAGYHPFELPLAKIRTIDLAGLRIDWTPADAGLPALDEPSVVPPTNALLNAWPDHLPFARLALSDGMLRIHRGDQTRSVTLTAAVTVTNDGTLIHGQLESLEPATRVHVDALVARDGPTQGSAAFDVRDPAGWLDLALNVPSPEFAHQLESSPWSGTMTVAIPAGASVATLTGKLDPVHLTFPAGRATVHQTSAAATVGRAGLAEISLSSGLGLMLGSGLEVEAPTVSLAIEETRWLTGQAENVRITLPDATHAEGDLRLTIDDAFAGMAASGTLGFDLRSLSLPGLTFEPFAGELRGGVEALSFSVPDLILTRPGRWHLTGLTGELRQPFASAAGLSAEGHLTGRWSSSFVADQALPFRLQAQRDGDQTTGTFSLGLTNILVPALAKGPAAQLAGMLTLGADLRTNRSEFSTRFDLVLPQAARSGWTLDDLTLTGEAQLTTGATAHPPLPGFALRLLPLLPGLTSGVLADGRLDVRGQASRFRLDNGLSLQEPRLRFIRQPGATAETGSWARVELGAAALNWRGFRISPLQAVGSVEDDLFHLEGSGSVAGRPCPFSLDVRVAGADPGKPDLIGELALGPLRLQRYPIPHQWTDGEDVWITGEATIESSVRLAADARWEASLRLVLDLTQAEWPAKKLTVENLSTTVTLNSLDPPQSRAGGDVLTVGRIAFDAYELTDVTVGFELRPEARVELQLADARLFGGHVGSAPFLWNLRTGDFEVSLNFENVDLQRVNQMFPPWGGSVTGRLEGRIPLSHKAGQWRTRGGRLQLNREVAGRLQYPSQGLLTGGMSSKSPRYAQLKLVEEGLENLMLQALTLDICDPETPRTPIRIHLEGTSISPRVIVPVILNLNLNGQFEEIVRLLNPGSYEWSF